MIVGAILTILVQSSSIFTSSLTPLVAVGVLTLDRTYPLTLGSNIGTTGTALLAALASDNLQQALQIALCHLFFNIFGIILWYPIPFMRKVPINLAKGLGNTTAKYRWFAFLYILLMFLVVPASVFALSLAGWQVIAAVGALILLLVIVIAVISFAQKKKPEILPKPLRSWDFLPKPLHSLEPYDRLITKGRDFVQDKMSCCGLNCCSGKVGDKTVTIHVSNGVHGHGEVEMEEVRVVEKF